MRKTLSDRLLQTIKATDKRQEISDDKVAGLSVRISPSGVKSFGLRYYDLHGSQDRITLGKYPALSIKAARSRAIDILRDLEEGIDPKGGGGLDTVNALYKQYEQLHIKNLAKADATRSLWERLILPKLGKKKLDKLRRPEVVAVLQYHIKSGLTIQVNRVHEQISAMLSWGVNAGHLQANCLAGMKKLVKEKARNRVFSDSELKKIWEATGELSLPSKQFVRSLILTGQRRDEVRCLPTTEVTLETGDWLLPPERNKSRRAHLIPLSVQAVDVLKDAYREGDYFFSVGGEKPYSGQSKLPARLEKLSGVEDIELHDFRRTMRTGMSRLKIPTDVAERCINHAQDTLDQTYNLHQYYDEKKEAFQRWADLVNTIISSEEDNVVDLNAKREA
ncbi:tyrosine-type recombinase/integrase [Kiloniella litopenaei]|uniref:tyrosine-type recombinase/integrase n=1 Tax=Kiloniella litopenaei TaxID=1549748 RepID=UPI003BA84294